MSWKWSVPFVLSVSVFAGDTNTQAVASAPAGNSFEAFRIIAQRNIFNPNRSNGMSRDENPQAARTVRNESFTLVGTMLYDDTQLAFFDSSSPGYKKVLKPGESIAGYKLTQIEPNHVKLTLDEKLVDLRIGQQMRREEEGEWSVSGHSAVETSTDAETSNTESAPAASGDEDEVLKRLMKKREEELNK